MFIDKKIQVVGLPRTCSSYLSNSINIVIQAAVNPNYVFLGEPIQSGTNRELNKYFALIKNKNVKVVKHHIDQFNKLIQHPNYKRIDDRFYTIGIIRNNIFDSALSLSVALYTNQYSNYTYANDKIVIDKHKFVNCLFFQIQRWELFVSLKHQFDEIVYSNSLTFNPVLDVNRLHLFSTPLEVDLLTDYALVENFKAPDKFTVVANYKELYALTINFLAEYFNPYIKVTGVNFEFRSANS